MSKDAGFFNLSLNNILSPDQSILEQARIRLLYYGLWIVMVVVAGLFLSVYFQHLAFLSTTAAVVFLSVVFLFKCLTYKPEWKIISHSLLTIATIINLLNVFA